MEANNEQNNNNDSNPEAEINGIFKMLAEDDLKNSIHIVHVNKPQDICTNLLNVDSPYNKCIMDNGADTTVIGKGWLVVAYTQRKANVIGFDKKAAVKKGLPIVSAVTAGILELKLCYLEYMRLC